MKDEGQDGGPRDRPERWTHEQRKELVLRVLRGDSSAGEEAASGGIDADALEALVERFTRAGEEAIRSGPRDEERVRYVRQLERKLGEMVLEMDQLRKLIKDRPT